MAKSGGRRIGRGYTRPAGVVGGGSKTPSRPYKPGGRQGQHPGAARGTKRVGG